MRPTMLARGTKALLPAALALLPVFCAIRAAGAERPGPMPTTPLREYVRVVEHPYLRVGLTVTVVDRQGRPVRGLTSADFRVLEDGEEFAIADFGPEGERRDRPLSVAVLLDLSYSMGGQVKKVREAARSLLSSLRPGDEIMVARFNDELTILQAFTGDPEDPAKALKRVGTATGGTAIFRSIDKTLRDLRERPGRKVILVVSDGLDNDIERGGSVFQSLYLQDLVRLCFRTQTTVYGVRPGLSALSWLPFEGFVEETGGRLLYTGGDLEKLFARLGEEFLAQYYLAYDIDPKRAGKRRRRIRVEVGRPGMTVKTVGGFVAPRDNIEALLSDLLDDEPRARADAVYELSFIPGPRTQHSMIKAATDSDEKVRRLAAQALGRLGDESGLEALLDLLGDPVPEVRAAAVDALVLFAARAQALLLEDVTRLTADQPAGLRLESAVRVLGRIGDDRALAPLSAALRGGGTSARAAAAQGLGDLGLSQGIPPLRDALTDTAPEVREAAARSIVSIAGSAAREIIEAYAARETDPRLKQAARDLLRP
jgi:VWFA-related protein